MYESSFFKDRHFERVKASILDIIFLVSLTPINRSASNQNRISAYIVFSANLSQLHLPQELTIFTRNYQGRLPRNVSCLKVKDNAKRNRKICK